jgi:hypothetical protein
MRLVLSRCHEGHRPHCISSLQLVLPEIVIGRHGLDGLVGGIEGEPLEAEHDRTLRQAKGALGAGTALTLPLARATSTSEFCASSSRSSGIVGREARSGKRWSGSQTQLVAYGTRSRASAHARNASSGHPHQVSARLAPSPWARQALSCPSERGRGAVPHRCRAAVEALRAPSD